MKELTFSVNDFGGVQLHTTRDAHVMQMMNVLINADYDAYPNSTIGIGLKDFQFTILRDDLLNKITYNIKELMGTVLPHINILEIVLEHDSETYKKVLDMKIKFSYYEDDVKMTSDVMYRFNDTNKLISISVDGDTRDL